MTDEEIRKMNKVTSRYTRGHMFKMMNEREPVIKENLAEIEARELENDEYMKKEIEELYPSEEIGIFPASSDVVRQEVKKYGEFLNSSFYNEIVSAAVENDFPSTEKEQVTYTDSLSENGKQDFSYSIGIKKED